MRHVPAWGRPAVSFLVILEFFSGEQHVFLFCPWIFVRTRGDQNPGFPIN